MKKRTTFAKRLPLGEGHKGHEVKRVSESSCVSPILQRMKNIVFLCKAYERVYLNFVSLGISLTVGFYDGIFT